MRDLERQFRITARSIPEIIGPMERVLSRFGESRAVTFRGRKLSNEAFINAAVLHVLEMEPEAQEKLIAASIARLEQILADDDQGAPAKAADGEEVPPGGVGRVIAERDQSELGKRQRKQQTQDGKEREANSNRHS